MHVVNNLIFCYQCAETFVGDGGPRCHDDPSLLLLNGLHSMRRGGDGGGGGTGEVGGSGENRWTRRTHTSLCNPCCPVRALPIGRTQFKSSLHPALVYIKFAFSRLQAG